MPPPPCTSVRCRNRDVNIVRPPLKGPRKALTGVLQIQRPSQALDQHHVVSNGDTSSVVTVAHRNSSAQGLHKSLVRGSVMLKDTTKVLNPFHRLGTSTNYLPVTSHVAEDSTPCTGSMLDGHTSSHDSASPTMPAGTLYMSTLRCTRFSHYPVNMRVPGSELTQVQRGQKPQHKGTLVNSSHTHTPCTGFYNCTPSTDRCTPCTNKHTPCMYLNKRTSRTNKSRFLVTLQGPDDETPRRLECLELSTNETVSYPNATMANGAPCPWRQSKYIPWRTTSGSKCEQVWGSHKLHHDDNMSDLCTTSSEMASCLSIDLASNNTVEARVHWGLTTSNTGVTDSDATNIHKERRGYHRCILMMAPLMIPPHQEPSRDIASQGLSFRAPLVGASCFQLGGSSIASTEHHTSSEQYRHDSPSVVNRHNKKVECTSVQDSKLAQGTTCTVQSNNQHTETPKLSAAEETRTNATAAAQGTTTVPKAILPSGGGMTRATNPSRGPRGQDAAAALSTFCSNMQGAFPNTHRRWRPTQALATPRTARLC